MPEFSVVVPLYNKKTEVERALRSILTQGVDDIEIIVVDDGSTDGSAQEVRKIQDARIRLVTQPNMGVSAARNWGIEEAKGDLIAFLDADDEWLSNFLCTIRELREAWPEAGAYATAFVIDKGDGIVHRCRSFGVPRRKWHGILPDYFRTRGTVWSSAVVVRKRTFADAGLFRRGVSMGEDLDMWARIALFYPIAYSTSACAVWHFTANNRACNRHVPSAYSVLNISAHELEGRTDVSPEMRQKFVRYAAEMSLSEIGNMCARGEREQAKASLAKYRQKYGISVRWTTALLLAQLPSSTMERALKIRSLAVRVALYGIRARRRLAGGNLQ